MSTALQIFYGVVIPAFLIGLVAALIGLANLDTYDPPTYEPPRRPRALVGEVLPGEPVRLPEPAYTPPPRPVLIVDAHLGVLDAPARKAGTPIHDRLSARRAVAAVRELVPAC